MNEIIPDISAMNIKPDDLKDLCEKSCGNISLLAVYLDSTIDQARNALKKANLEKYMEEQKALQIDKAKGVLIDLMDHQNPSIRLKAADRFLQSEKANSQVMIQSDGNIDVKAIFG